MYDGAQGGAVHDTHSMDVQALGPALIAFGHLIKESNAALNGKNAEIKILVNSDFEHKCFSISFEVIQYIHQLGDLVRDLKTAKDILQALGLLFGSRGLGLLGYLNWKKRRRVLKSEAVGEKGIRKVELNDGSTELVQEDAFELSKLPKIRTAVEKTLIPLGLDGVETIKFDGKVGSAIYSIEDAKSIIDSFEIIEANDTLAFLDDQADDTEIVLLRVRSPVFDENSKKWDFYYNGRKISVDISRTSIATDTMARRGAFVDDTYKVRLKTGVTSNSQGKETIHYTIIEVLDFIPAMRQIELPLKGDGKI